MRGVTKFVVLLSAAALVLATAGRAQARSEEATVRAASEVLDEFVKMQIKDIPVSLLSDAKGVVIVPNLVKLGFVIGGQRGRGVVMVREADGSWRAPTFLTLTGGSIGWQIGAQSSDIVLVFKTQKSVEGLLSGKFTLGADAAVAAGPVGRRAAAATDGELKAEIYSYSRTRGLFAGISIDGSVLEINDAETAAYYGAAGPGGAATIPESALALVQNVARLTADPDPVPRNSLAPREAVGPQPPREGVVTRSVLATRSAESLRGEVAASAAGLNPLLDQGWRRYLALPAEVYQSGRHPSVEALAASLNRYETVATTADYRALAGRPEFQAAYGKLQAYYDALAATGTAASPQLALPPPPGSQR
jgi:lipid-binding SYLF domain-containing protein